MEKPKLLGAALLFLLVANPAMAQHLVTRCQHHQLGNPYTPEQDYMAWSAWRARGSWAEPSQPCRPVTHPRRHSANTR
jgi:hypothetical protein